MAKSLTSPTNESVQEALQIITDKNGGILQPEAVVAAAKNAKSPLHAYFEWDDKKASHQWRIEQARRLIRSVRVEVRTTTRVIRAVAYVRNPQAEPSEQGYVETKKLRNDEDLAREAVYHEFARAAAALTRARELSAALGLEDEVDKLIEGLEAIRRPLQGGGDGGASAGAPN